MAAYQPIRAGVLGDVAGIHSEHGSVEEHAFVVAIKRRRHRDVVDAGDALVRGAVRRRQEVEIGSPVQSTPSAETKNTDSPSGAATAGRSASPGFTTRGRAATCRPSAEAANPVGSSASKATAATAEESSSGVSGRNRQQDGGIRLSPYCDPFRAVRPRPREPQRCKGVLRHGEIGRGDT